MSMAPLGEPGTRETSTICRVNVPAPGSAGSAMSMVGSHSPMHAEHMSFESESESVIEADSLQPYGQTDDLFGSPTKAPPGLGLLAELQGTPFSVMNMGFGSMGFESGSGSSIYGVPASAAPGAALLHPGPPKHSHPPSTALATILECRGNADVMALDSLSEPGSSALAPRITDKGTSAGSAMNAVLPLKHSVPGELVQERRGENYVNNEQAASRHVRRGQRVDIGTNNELNMSGYVIRDTGMELAGASAGGPGMTDESRACTFKNSCIRLAHLGEGASGAVYKIVHVPSMTLMAAKVIPLNEEGKTHSVRQEFATLAKNKGDFPAAHLNSVDVVKVDEKRPEHLRAPQIVHAAEAGERAARALFRNEHAIRVASMHRSQQSLSHGPGDVPFEAHSAAGLSDTDTQVWNNQDWMGTSVPPTGPCPYLVEFYDAFLDGEQRSLVFVTEYMDAGSLQNIIDGNATRVTAEKGLSLEQINEDMEKQSKNGVAVPNPGATKSESMLICIAWCCLRGLAHLHSQRLIHRDIKPSNILINSRSQIKIADFGIIKELGSDCDETRTHVGTQQYMSPERLDGKAGYGMNSDVWSLGLTLLALALGRYPVPGEGGYWDLLEKLEVPLCLPPVGRGGFSQELVNMLRAMLTIDPRMRPQAVDLLSHPAFRKWEKMLRWRYDSPRGLKPVRSLSPMPACQMAALEHMAMRVQEYRYIATIQLGAWLTHFPYMPEHKLIHLSAQTGWPVAIVEAEFMRTHDMFDKRIQLLWQQVRKDCGPYVFQSTGSCRVGRWAGVGTGIGIMPQPHTRETRLSSRPKGGGHMRRMDRIKSRDGTPRLASIGEVDETRSKAGGMLSERRNAATTQGPRSIPQDNE